MGTTVSTERGPAGGGARASPCGGGSSASGPGGAAALGHRPPGPPMSVPGVSRDRAEPPGKARPSSLPRLVPRAAAVPFGIGAMEEELALPSSRRSSPGSNLYLSLSLTLCCSSRSPRGPPEGPGSRGRAGAPPPATGVPRECPGPGGARPERPVGAELSAPRSPRSLCKGEGVQNSPEPRVTGVSHLLARPPRAWCCDSDCLQLESFGAPNRPSWAPKLQNECSNLFVGIVCTAQTGG